MTFIDHMCHGIPIVFFINLSSCRGSTSSSSYSIVVSRVEFLKSFQHHHYHHHCLYEVVVLRRIYIAIKQFNSRSSLSPYDTYVRLLVLRVIFKIIFSLNYHLLIFLTITAVIVFIKLFFCRSPTSRPTHPLVV